jgi:hypothetical protein
LFLVLITKISLYFHCVSETVVFRFYNFLHKNLKTEYKVIQNNFFEIKTESRELFWNKKGTSSSISLGFLPSSTHGINNK